MPDPKTKEDPSSPRDPIEDLIGPDESEDSAEKIEEEGEPFDGNFA